MKKNIKDFQSFNENGLDAFLNKFPDEQPPVKVKHLIEYLQQFDQESPVELDKEGWESEDPMEAIELSGLFSSFSGSLFINN